MNGSEQSRRPIGAGDKVRHAPTQDQGKVRLGDTAPAFRPGDKVIRDAATQEARCGSGTPRRLSAPATR
jgi:hypothetical protein